MDEITLLQECVVNVEEVKEELCDTFENKDCDMLGKDTVKTEYSTAESQVSEQNDSEEEELKPIASVYIKTELESDEGTEEQDHLPIYPLTDCKDWDENKTVADPLLLRVKKVEATETEEEAWAGLSNERSKQAATEEVDDASNRNKVESAYQERVAPKPENKDMPSQPNVQPFAYVDCSDTSGYETTLKESEGEHQEECQLLKCKTCDRQFTSRRALGGHVKVHINEAEKKTKFPCETCGKEFKRRDDLKEHLHIHTGEKPYICDHCGKGFKSRSALIVHRRTHTGEQPYSCSICNKQFADTGTLTKHTRRHLNIKPYGCKECGKTFVQSSDYTVHLRVHSGERPYKCSICSKTFAHKQNLNTHMFTHSREPKHMAECELCGESYRATYMRTHMRTHTGEKPYKCRFCNAAFTQSSNRITHEATHSTHTR